MNHESMGLTWTNLCSSTGLSISYNLSNLLCISPSPPPFPPPLPCTFIGIGPLQPDRGRAPRVAATVDGGEE
jgi:hypothetical protein